jgi:pyruvate dehydrogenase E2 component (dihydrolipoamide acetyltransferase)
MAEELFIPKLGQTVEEVTLINWLVEDGAKVSQGQEVMEVETDKAVFPVEANAKGYIHLGPYKEGQVLPVLTVVATIGKQEDKFEIQEASLSSAPDLDPAVAEINLPMPDQRVAPAGEVSVEDKRIFASPRARKLANNKSVDLSGVPASGYGGVRVIERDVLDYLTSGVSKVTPVAQRIADQSGINLRGVPGSGPGGRIVKEDVIRLASSSTSVAGSQDEVIERILLKGVRAIIADRMATSVHTTARVTLVTEVDATEFFATRMRIKEKVEQDWGFAPGYNDLLGKIVTVALRRFPYMNARITPDAIEILGNINLGMAVDTERGLLVPVIRGADRLTLRQFGTEFRRLMEAARNNRSLPDDLSGGTFTLTSLGTYEIDAFTPVINLPEAAILGIGRIAPKVVAYKGEAAIRQMWTLSLVFDHRLNDGAPAARFLQAIKQMVEEPYLALFA